MAGGVFGGGGRGQANLGRDPAAAAGRRPRPGKGSPPLLVSVEVSRRVEAPAKFMRNKVSQF